MVKLDLHWLERLAVWWLRRSRRTSMVIVKTLDSSAIFYSIHREDPLACMVARDIQFAAAAFAATEEHPAHTLERIYHQPSHGERE